MASPKAKRLGIERATLIVEKDNFYFRSGIITSSEDIDEAITSHTFLSRSKTASRVLRYDCSSRRIVDTADISLLVTGLTIGPTEMNLLSVGLEDGKADMIFTLSDIKEFHLSETDRGVISIH